MARKRRKPSRPRNRPQAASTRTAERSGPPTDAEDRAPAAPAPKPHRPPGPKAPAGPQRSRAEKKELAREQREYVRKRMARARRARQAIWIGGIALVVAVGAFLLTNRNEAPASASSLPGLLKTEAPWPANADRSAARADALGLPAEGTTMHEHANVQVFVNGEQQTVPTDIGIDAGAGTIQSIHTHDDTGVVHLESSQARTFTLGEFFGVWGVRFTPSCLGAYCNDDTNQIRVYVNGEEQTGDARQVPLDDQSVIVVTYGTQKQLPDPIPSSFDFSTINP